MGSQPLRPLMVRLALPSIAAQVVSLLYNIMDRVFVGHIPDAGADALTGLGVVLPVTVLIQALGMWVGAGAAPLAGMRLGAGDARGVQRAVGNAVVLLGIMCVISLVVFVPAGPALLGVFGASEATLPYASTYFAVYLVGTPFLLASSLSTLLLAQGAAKEVLVANIVSSVLNIALNALFIFGFGWGVAGAAAATVIAQAVCAAMIVGCLQRPSSAFRIERTGLRLHAETVRRIFGIGVGRFFVNSTEGILVIVLNAQMQVYGGDLFVAALTVLTSYQLVCFGIVSGFTQGTQGILSYCYGARLRERFRTACVVTVITALAIEGACVAAVIAFSGPLAGLFTDDAQVAALVGQASPVFLAGLAVFGAQIGMQSILMGTGRGMQSLLVAAVRKIVLFIPLAFILPPFFGAWGVIYAEPVSDFLSVISCSLILACSWRGIMRFGEPRGK